MKILLRQISGNTKRVMLTLLKYLFYLLRSSFTTSMTLDSITETFDIVRNVFQYKDISEKTGLNECSTVKICTSVMIYNVMYKCKNK